MTRPPIMARRPYYEHAVVYPFHMGIVRDGNLYPCEGATEWLFEGREVGEVGPWDSCLGYADAEAATVVVSFLRSADAVRFKLLWVPDEHF